MKILILNETLRLGGAEAMSIGLANALLENNEHNVFFVSAPGPLRERLNPKIEFFSISFFSFLKAPLIVIQLKNIIKSIRPDIIHAHGSTIGVLAILALGGNNKKVISIVTHHLIGFSRVPTAIAKLIYNLLFDQIIAISNCEHAALILAGVNRDKISVIHNYIDVGDIQKKILSLNKEEIRKEFKIDINSKVILSIGRLVPDKGCYAFIETVKLCSAKTNKKIVGLVVGNGSELSKLKRLAYNCQKNCEIKFVGYQEDILRFLAISDVFLFPSKHEVLPMVLLEACAAAVPIVCSDIPGNNEIVKHNYNGFLAKETEYYKYILQIFEDPNLADLIKSNAKKIAIESFDKKNVLNKVISLYKNLYSRNLK
jgi:glycosyltransferase involved in cell wall biosynthesis